MKSGPDFAALGAELAKSQNPRERAAICGKLLAAVGEARRCGKPVGDGELNSLQPDDLDGFLGAFDGDAIRGELQRAAESAVEAALTENEAEKKEFEAWALEALRSRDEVASALCALELLAARAPLRESTARARERLLAELVKVDALSASVARRLTPLNSQRRNFRDRLHADHRAAAWWFSLRSDCDALEGLWNHAELPHDVTAHCADCARDWDSAAKASRPPSGHVTEDELWNLDLGELPAARRRLIEKHARGCTECALALKALEVPLQEGESAPQPAVAAEPSKPSEAPPQVLASRAEFKVLLFRKPPRIVVAPAVGQRLAAAALKLSGGKGSVPARVTAQGLEITLGGKVRGSLRVELPSGKSFDIDVDV